MKIKNSLNRIEQFAWDCTVGAGNNSEIVNYRALDRHLGRPASGEEMTCFGHAWARCLQEMAQV